MMGDNPGYRVCENGPQSFCNVSNCSCRRIGAKDERERIVSWLRNGSDLPSLDSELADAIERGDHA